MKASEIINELFALSGWESDRTCDTIKSGSPDTVVTKVAVSMFATPEVVKNAHEWGAELLIVHEPTYYNHMDDHSDEAIENEKRRFIESTGITICRFHDHPHHASPDTICEGEMKYMKLDGDISYTGAFDQVRVHLHNPTTPRELARQIEENTGIAHIRICGAADIPCTEVTGMFGTPGGVFEELKREGSEIVMTGEACEWALGEYARDAAQLGHRKALLILGHIGSERDGMKLTAERLAKAHPELGVRYFECGEVYTYTDSKII